MMIQFETTDFDEFTEAQQNWKTTYRPIKVDNFRASLWSGLIDGIQCDMEHWDNALEIVGSSPDRGLSVVLPLTDSSTYLSRGREVTGECIDLYGGEQEIFALMRPRMDLLSIAIHMDILRKREDCPYVEVLARHVSGHAVIYSNPLAVRNLRRLALRFIGVSHQELGQTFATDRLLDEMLDQLACALEPAENQGQPRVFRRYALARRARDYLLDRQSEPPTLSQVCTELGTSERALHYAFSDIFNVTPKAFLKGRRLFAVHQALKSAAPGEHVVAVAMRFGFWDLGYFARDYQAMFGELPSTTLRKSYAGAQHDARVSDSTLKKAANADGCCSRV